MNLISSAMKKIAFALVFACGLHYSFAWNPATSRAVDTVAGSPHSPEFRKIESRAFQIGESLRFKLHYGLVNAGIAELKVENIERLNGREVFHIVGTGKSVGMFDWFYKVRDRYETYLDVESVMPWKFIRDVDEGGYTIQRNITFDHAQGSAQSDGKTYEVPPYVQDIFSAFYYSRCLDVSDLQPGDFLEIETFLDHEIYTLRLKYLHDEPVKSELGLIHCLAFRPYVQAGRVFKEADDMTIWVSSDPNHIPVRLQTDLLIGSIKMDLIDAKGLLHPLARVSD